MFLTKKHFDESKRIIKAYEKANTDSEVKLAVALDFAKDIFDDFEMMKKDEQDEVVKMILDDISINLYSLN